MKRSLSMRQNFEITISVFFAATFRLNPDLDPDLIKGAARGVIGIIQKIPWYVLIMYSAYTEVEKVIKIVSS